MAADEPLLAEIIDQTHDGKGVADLDGRRIFVAGALPGERVVLAPRRRRRRYQEAELIRIEQPARQRVDPQCQYFGRCGGCALQHMSYWAQLEFKQGLVAQAFARIGAIEPERWLDPIAAEQWGYRRRARLGVKYVEGKGRALVGFRERAAPYITDMDSCPVMVGPVESLLGELARLITSCSRRDRIPQLEVAVGDTHAAIVVRVLESLSAEDVAAFVDFGRRHDIDMYVQPGGPGTVAPMSNGSRTLFYLLEDSNVRIEFAPTDFIQVNGRINAKMVAEALRRAELRPSDRVLDLYCGLGNFSLPFARHAAELLGVEGEAGLVARALHNASINRVSNARFVAADLMQEEWTFLQEHWDIVLLDPPRTGAERAVSQMGAMAPRRIIYVSCHPATLARDAGVLCEQHRYRLSSVRVFDMFPNTHHAEVMAVFDRIE